MSDDEYRVAEGTYGVSETPNGVLVIAGADLLDVGEVEVLVFRREALADARFAAAVLNCEKPDEIQGMSDGPWNVERNPVLAAVNLEGWVIMGPDEEHRKTVVGKVTDVGFLAIAERVAEFRNALLSSQPTIAR